jgi:hypothetical protein
VLGVLVAGVLGEHEVAGDGVVELEEADVVEAGAQEGVVGEFAVGVLLVDALVGLAGGAEAADLLVGDGGVVEGAVGVGVLGGAGDEGDVAVGGGLELAGLEQQVGLLEAHGVAEGLEVAGELGRLLAGAARLGEQLLGPLLGALEVLADDPAVDDREAGVDRDVVAAVGVDDLDEAVLGLVEVVVALGQGGGLEHEGAGLLAVGLEADVAVVGGLQGEQQLGNFFGLEGALGDALLGHVGEGDAAGLLLVLEVGLEREHDALGGVDLAAGAGVGVADGGVGLGGEQVLAGVEQALGVVVAVLVGAGGVGVAGEVGLVGEGGGAVLVGGLGVAGGAQGLGVGVALDGGGDQGVLDELHRRLDRVGVALVGEEPRGAAEVVAGEQLAGAADGGVVAEGDVGVEHLLLQRGRGGGGGPARQGGVVDLDRELPVVLVGEQVAEGGVDLGDVGFAAAVLVVAVEAGEAPAVVGVAVEVPVVLDVALGDVADRVVAQGEGGVVGVGLLELGDEADELVELGRGVGEVALEVEGPGDAQHGLVVELALGVPGGLGVGGEGRVELVEVVVDLADAQPGLGDVLRAGAPRDALAVVAAAPARRGRGAVGRARRSGWRRRGRAGIAGRRRSAPPRSAGGRACRARRRCGCRRGSAR